MCLYVRGHIHCLFIIIMLGCQWTCCVCINVHHTHSKPHSENGVSFCSHLIGCTYVRTYVCPCQFCACTCVCTYVRMYVLVSFVRARVYVRTYVYGNNLYRHNYVRMYYKMRMYIHLLYCEPDRSKHKKRKTPVICKFSYGQDLNHTQ